MLLTVHSEPLPTTEEKNKDKFLPGMSQIRKWINYKTLYRFVLKNTVQVTKPNMLAQLVTSEVK